MNIVKNLKRYYSTFAEYPYLVEIPVGGHSDCGDSTQPYSRFQPSPTVPRELWTSIATYPVDGEAIIFGFKYWVDAAEFSVAVCKNGYHTEVEKIDQKIARSDARIWDMAYALWYHRTNSHRMPWPDFLKEHRTGMARHFMDATLNEIVEAETRVGLSWPGTPIP